MAKNFEIRQYQIEARDKIIAGLQSSKVSELLLALCAGGGKTYISKMVIDAITDIKGIDYQIAFCSPYNSITSQTTSYFEGCGIYQTGVKRRPDPNSNVTLFTMQTFENMFITKSEKTGKPKFELFYKFIILDEVQLMQTKVQRLQKLIKENGLDTKLLFLSATPYDGAGYLLPIVEKATPVLPWKYANAKEYIKRGNLLPLVVKQLAKTPIKESHLVTNQAETDFTEEVHNEALKNSVDVVETVHPYLGDYSTIVLATNIEHAEKITEDFRAKGYSVKALHSKVDGKKDGILEEFKRGEFQIIVSVRMITVGTDMPIAINLVVATLIASLAVWIQACARVQRIGGGSNIAYIYDLFGNADRLGSPLQLVEPKPLSEKPTKKAQRCEACGETFSLTLISSVVEEGVAWKTYVKTCCGEKVVRGQELESTVCANCNTQYEVEDTKQVNREIVSFCPHCNHPNALELITPYELTTLMRDRGEYVLQMFSVYKDYLREQQVENFKKWLTVYAVFAEDNELIESLDSALSNIDAKKKIEEINNIIYLSKEFRKKFYPIVNLFKKEGFNISDMAEVAEIVIEGFTKGGEIYIKRLKNRLTHWGFFQKKDIDYKRLKKNIKTHQTAIF
jgi:superfamily II DNA or RNA helicase